MITLKEMVKSQQSDVERLKQQKAKASVLGPFNHLQAILTNAETEKEDAKEKASSKKNRKSFYKSSSTSDFDQKASDQSTK